MRGLVKFLILLVIAFGVMTIYGVFSFEAGFIRSINDASKEAILLAESFKYVQIGDDRYFISFISNGKLFGGICSSDDVGLLAIFQAIKQQDATEISPVSFIIGAVLFLIVLFFPTKRRKKSS